MKKGIAAFEMQDIKKNAITIKGGRKRPGRAKYGDITLEKG